MGGSYSLIHYTSFKPLPDYWASVLHKRLMGTAVLDVRNSLQMGRSVRTWASCAHKNAGAPRGAVTLLILNTRSTVASVKPVANGTQPNLDLLLGGWDEYLLTPADSSAGLSSDDVALNGRKLAIAGASGPNPTLPHLPARAREGSELSLPGLSFGYFGKQPSICFLRHALSDISLRHAGWFSVCTVLKGARAPGCS